MCWVEVSVVVVVVGKLLLELVEIAEIPLVVVVVVVGKLLLELVEIAEIPLVQPIIQKKTVIPNLKKKGKLNTLQQQQHQKQDILSMQLH